MMCRSDLEQLFSSPSCTQPSLHQHDIDIEFQTNNNNHNNNNGAAADLDATRKEAKYTSLTNSYIFQPIAVESHGSFSASALSFPTTLGERLTGTSGDLREISYLFIF